MADCKITNCRILVTGGAGFIGSNLAENLLAQGNDVVVLDNFSTGKRENLASFATNASFTLMEGDIRNFADCQKAVAGCDYVLHEAALGSVPRSFEHPQQTMEVNVQGFNNMIEAARLAGVKRFVYASSSSVYGDDDHLPKIENSVGNPLSPYALSKQINEAVAMNYSRLFQLPTIGLRYFNVFGRRQDPLGAYAAVIPKFIISLLKHQSPLIHGDGTYSRDFTYIDNVIQANLLALTAEAPEALNQVYNVAFGQRTDLNQIFRTLQENLAQFDPQILTITPTYGPKRTGDIPHSLANIDKARESLGYIPAFRVHDGLKQTLQWYLKNFREQC